MKIAICDDDSKDIAALTVLLTAYARQTGCDLCLQTYDNGDRLLRALATGNPPELLLLDVLMPGMNGISVARELREAGYAGELVFLTASPDFALDAFSVKAQDYLIKPIAKQMLFRTMDALTARLDRDETVILHEKKGARRIAPDRIEYCESLGHTLLWHLRSGAVIESTGGMNEAEALLRPSGLFLRVHRSFLVNHRCIRAVNRNTLCIELEHMTRIPVPKAKYSAILEQYLQAQRTER